VIRGVVSQHQWPQRRFHLAPSKMDQRTLEYQIKYLPRQVQSKNGQCSPNIWLLIGVHGGQNMLDCSQHSRRRCIIHLQFDTTILTGLKEIKQCRIFESIGCHIVGNNFDAIEITTVISRRPQQALAQALGATVGEATPPVSTELDISIKIRVIVFYLSKIMLKGRTFIIPLLQILNDDVHDNGNDGVAVAPFPQRSAHRPVL
jgi:hypothetical protein